MLERFFARQSAADEAAARQPFTRFFDQFPSDYRPAPPAAEPELARCEQHLGAALPAPLRALLSLQNGGSFRGGMFHLMGACRALKHDDLATWNHPQDWKAAFPGCDLTRYVFFADDAFGNQFGYLTGEGEADPAVWRFDIQVGEFLEVAPALSAFLTTVLPDDGVWLLGGDYLDAYREHGSDWSPGYHLSLVVPSLLGGSFTADNLHPMAPAINMHLAGQVVTQVKPLPPGTEIRGFHFDLATQSLKLNIIRL